MRDWNHLADRVLAEEPASFDEALAVLAAADDELLPLLHAAFRIRFRYHGRDVRIHVLQNAKSGLCPEDCGFCSQSVKFRTGVERYPLQSVSELVDGARKAAALGAVKYCMVTSTRGPSDRDLDVICEAVRQIKSELNINVCTSLGLLKDGPAERLAPPVSPDSTTIWRAPGRTSAQCARPIVTTSGFRPFGQSRRREWRPAAAASWEWGRARPTG